MGHHSLLKDSHIGDTFTNTEPAPAENAGKSWRFVKNGSTYSWTLIADSDAVKALLEASKAQATADGKSTTHYSNLPIRYLAVYLVCNLPTSVLIVATFASASSMACCALSSASWAALRASNISCATPSR